MILQIQCILMEDIMKVCDIMIDHNDLVQVVVKRHVCAPSKACIVIQILRQRKISANMQIWPCQFSISCHDLEKGQRSNGYHAMKGLGM